MSVRAVLGGLLVLAFALFVLASVATAAPVPPDAPVPPVHDQDHDHDHNHGGTAGRQAGKLHHDDSEDLASHLPIQVYYHRAYHSQPWRQPGAWRVVGLQTVALLIVEGLLLAGLWRRRGRA